MAAFERPEPALRSSRESDPEVEFQIDAFVIGLGETVDALQDAEAAGQLAALRALAEGLVPRARELGYESLSESAQQIAEACGDPNPDAARKAIETFTELSKRARRGHRSAAP
jgi:hypothetical protein